MQRIGVWGVCDTGGLTAVLRSAMRDREIVPFVAPDSADVLPEFYAAMKGVDLLLVGRSHEVALGKLPDIGVEMIVYPRFMFNAFHPDCVYLRRRRPDGGVDPFLNPHYNSAIIAWCYLNEVPIEKVPALFRSEVFESLGYFDRWNAAVDFWRGEFDYCGFEFDRFFLKVKRSGAFMHSLNHPKVDVFAPFAQALADKIAVKTTDANGPTYAPDALSGNYWPLYPEVAEIYGLPGSYEWNIDGRAAGLREFVEWAYRHYATVLPRQELIFEWPDHYDRVLTPYL